MTAVFKTRKSKKNRESVLLFDDITVSVIRKNIKNLHLKVLPPNGEVRVSSPIFVSNSTIKHFVIGHKDWIKEQKIAIAATTAAKAAFQYTDNETLFYLGKAYKIQLAKGGKPAVELKSTDLIQINIRNDSTTEQRERLVNSWYRQQLKTIIPELLLKWQPIVGKSVSEWGVRKMKTRWGSCNISDKRIWLNLELIKKPIACLEMVLVHELVHLHEPYHNKNFYRLMNQFMPNWQQYDALLVNKHAEYEKLKA